MTPAEIVYQRRVQVLDRAGQTSVTEACRTFLGADYHASRIDRDRKTRNLVHQLQALGHKVTLQPAA